jgi:hypothetical protein
VGNRLPGGCVFGERSKTKTEGAEHASVKPKRPKHRADWFCRCVLAIQLSACADATARRSVAHHTFTNTSWRSVQTFLVLLHTEAGGTPAFQPAPLRGYCRLAPTQPSGGRLPTIRLPTRLGVQFKLFWFYYAQRRAGRPRSSPRRFAAIVGLRRRNRPAVGYPPYVCRHVLAFSSNLFGAITHRGGRDARVPVRAASRLLIIAQHNHRNAFFNYLPLISCKFS